MQSKKRTSKLKGFIFSITAILMGLIAVLVLSEIVLRLAGITPFHRNALNSFHVADPYLGWKGLKNFSGILAKANFRALISFDQNGYRKKTSKVEPKSNAVKIVFQGDSFAWGWGVSQGELLTDLLQDKFGENYNIMNYGINTFGTVQEKLQLQREILPLKPRYVGLLIYSNDFQDNLNGRNNNRPYCVVEGNTVVLKNMPIENPIGSLYRSFTRMSYALTHLRYYHNYFKEYLKMFARLFKKTHPVTHSATQDEIDITLGRDEIFVFEHYFELINRICIKNNIHLFIVYVPTGHVIGQGGKGVRDPYYQIVKKACDRHRIKLINLNPAFRKRVTGKHGEPLYFSKDPHWSAAGHRLAAEVIYQSLKDRL
ncbi:MAG: hypothetical protein JRJ85_16290 [Deltaproteobacteria bacterium]|nr:hypothetical protein [Deltaproteobacteria bacterium]